MRFTAFVAALIVAGGALADGGRTVQPAFPTAVGYGKYATGWRTGRVIKVTNTNDSGSGSLRACAEDTGPRVCVFETGGTIDVESSIVVNSDVYIAGQTVPDDSGGIQIRLNATNNTSASPILIQDADNVVIRHIRVRPGPGLTSTAGVDAITIQDSSDIAIANVSLAYSTDELFNVDADSETVQNITLQDSLLYFALRNANHPEGAHSKGMLICSIRASNVAAGNRCGRITIARNILGHNRDRNPDFTAGGLPIEAFNNYIYNPGTETFELHEGNGVTTSMMMVNNLMVAGSDTVNTQPFIRVADDLNDRGLGGSEVEMRVYVRGNIDPFDRTNSGLAEDLSVDSVERDTILSEPEGISTAGAIYAAEDLQSILPTTAGARVPALDQLDINFTNQALAGSGGSDKNDPSGVTGPGLTGGYPTPAAGTPEADADDDGMPDAWEIARDGDSANVNRFNAWEFRAGTDLRNLDEYLSVQAGDIPDPTQ